MPWGLPFGLKGTNDRFGSVVGFSWTFDFGKIE